MKEILLKKISEMSDLINSLSEEDGELKETVEEGNLSDLIANNDCNTNNEGVIKTGFSSIDEGMEGFLPGEISVVGGRPAMVKTNL